MPLMLASTGRLRPLGFFVDKELDAAAASRQGCTAVLNRDLIEASRKCS